MLTFFFFACLFEMEPSEWFCVLFVQKRNKAAVVQLACENCAKHEDLLQLRQISTWETGPRPGGWQPQQKRAGEAERHLHCSWSV